MPAETDPMTIEDVKRLRVEPGDVLVLKLPGATAHQLGLVGDELKEVFPDNKVLVIDSEAELTVVETEPEAGDR